MIEKFAPLFQPLWRPFALLIMVILVVAVLFLTVAVVVLLFDHQEFEWEARLYPVFYPEGPESWRSKWAYHTSRMGGLFGFMGLPFVLAVMLVFSMVLDRRGRPARPSRLRAWSLGLFIGSMIGVPVVFVVIYIGLGLTGAGHGSSEVLYIGLGLGVLTWLMMLATSVTGMLAWSHTGICPRWVTPVLILLFLLTWLGRWMSGSGG